MNYQWVTEIKDPWLISSDKPQIEDKKEDVNQSLDIKTDKIKEVKVIVNDSLNTKETTIIEQF